MAKLDRTQWFERKSSPKFSTKTGRNRDLTEMIVDYLTIDKKSDYMEGMVSESYADQALKVYKDCEARGSTLAGDPQYLMGRILAARENGADLESGNINHVMDMVRYRRDEYKELSPIGRFFSYLNPFPNKYRDMRNEINAAKDFLVNKKGMERAEIDRFLKEETGPVAFPEKGPNLEAKEEARAWLNGMNAAIEKGTTARGTMAKDRVAMDAFLKTLDRNDVYDYEEKGPAVDMDQAMKDFQNETEMVPEYEGPKLTNKDLFAMMAAELGEETVKKEFDLPDNFLDNSAPAKGGKDDPSLD